MKLARERLKAQRGELPQWCNFGFGVLDKYKSNPNELVSFVWIIVG